MLGLNGTPNRATGSTTPYIIAGSVQSTVNTDKHTS